MNNCPNCGKKIPLKEFVFVSNFKNITCPSCGEELLPEKKTLSVIGGISGFAAALTVGLALIVYFLLNRTHLIEIVIITFLLEISIFLASALITRNILKLTLKTNNYEKN